jgi:TM2 domain-containing membrane protein YozV
MIRYFSILIFLLFVFNSAVKAEKAVSSLKISYELAGQDTFITNKVLKEKDPVTALVLCTFFGPLGVHRIYLGTSVSTAVAYVVTGAGFGILWITDMILIIGSLRKDDVSDISNNRHFFLWNK